MSTNDLINSITEAVIKEIQNIPNMNFETLNIPLGISNRHVHLSSEDVVKLFGDGGELTIFKPLSQPGQFASEQKVTLVGPKGVIEAVRVLGPARTKTQVEISVSDCFKLGVKAPIRDSGDLAGSASITLVGPKGSVTIPEGTIIAARHIHMHTSDGVRFGLQDGERVNVKTLGPRGLVFSEVLVRVNEKYQLEMHVDTDEANAACLKNGELVELK